MTKNQPDPLVSITCMAYNHEKYIAQSIEGFLSQKTTFPYEILIHDDASTDRTVEIINKYKAKYPNLMQVICQTENQYSKGIKITSTYLWPRAKGRYIAICDGDDYWTDPYKLQKQVMFLEANPEYVVSYHDGVCIDAEGKLINKPRLPAHCKKDFTPVELRRCARLLTLSIVFRNVIGEVPDEYNKAFNGDRFLTCMLGLHGKGKYFDDIKPGAYRVHGQSMWSSKSGLRKKYLNNDTRAWLYRYYRRISNNEDAEYLKHKFMGGLENILKNIPSPPDFSAVHIFKNIVSDYNDIVDEKAWKTIHKRAIRKNPALGRLWLDTRHRQSWGDKLLRMFGVQGDLS